jgi:hypothetical protein
VRVEAARRLAVAAIRPSRRRAARGAAQNSRKFDAWREIVSRDAAFPVALVTFERATGKAAFWIPSRILSASRLARPAVAPSALFTGARNSRTASALECSAEARYEICANTRIAPRAKLLGSWSPVPRKIAGQEVTRRLAKTEEPIRILVRRFICTRAA